MPEAQVIGAIAVRVEADLSGYTEEMRALRTGMAALEKTPITIKVKLDSGNEFARVKAQIAEMQRQSVAGGAGGVGGRFSEGGVAQAVRAGSMPPSYTVDGRGFLVNSGGFPGVGGGGGGRFSFGNAGSSQTTTPQQAAQQINQSVNTLMQSWTQQTVNLMQSMTQQISQQFAHTVNTSSWTGGSNWTNTTNNSLIMGRRGGGGRGMGRGGIAGILGPSLRGFTRSFGILAATGASDVVNARMDRDLAMDSTNDPLEQSKIELDYQQSHGIPIVGAAGGGIRNAINAGRQWLSRNAADNFAGRIISRFANFGDTNTRQDVQAGQMDAQRANDLANVQGAAASAHVLANGKIAIASAGFDTIARQTAEISTNLEKAKIETNDFYNKAIAAQGGKNSANAPAIEAARALALGDLGRVSGSERGRVRASADAMAVDFGISRNASNALLTAGGSINDPITRQRVAIGEAQNKMFSDARQFQNSPALLKAFYESGNAQIRVMGKQLDTQVADARYDLATRQQIAAIHTGATGLTSDQYISGASSITARGRALAHDVQAAPDELREQIRAAGISELRAERADLTRVGSKTYAESVDSGFTSIAGMQSTGESAEELRRQTDLLDQSVKLLTKISNNSGGTVGP